MTRVFSFIAPPAWSSTMSAGASVGAVRSGPAGTPLIAKTARLPDAPPVERKSIDCRVLPECPRASRSKLREVSCPPKAELVPLPVSVGLISGPLPAQLPKAV